MPKKLQSNKTALKKRPGTVVSKSRERVQPSPLMPGTSRQKKTKMTKPEDEQRGSPPIAGSSRGQKMEKTEGEQGVREGKCITIKGWSGER
jgi:hypothetical protein